VLADCDPEPLTVATCKEKSFTTFFRSSRLDNSCGPISVVAMNAILGSALQMMLVGRVCIQQLYDTRIARATCWPRSMTRFGRVAKPK
jgi:hypothetical protein